MNKTYKTKYIQEDYEILASVHRSDEDPCPFDLRVSLVPVSADKRDYLIVVSYCTVSNSAVDFALPCTPASLYEVLHEADRTLYSFAAEQLPEDTLELFYLELRKYLNSTTNLLTVQI